jgi:hypothetical protein
MLRAPKIALEARKNAPKKSRDASWRTNGSREEETDVKLHVRMIDEQSGSEISPRKAEEKNLWIQTPSN